MWRIHPKNQINWNNNNRRKIVRFSAVRSERNIICFFVATLLFFLRLHYLQTYYVCVFGKRVSVCVCIENCTIMSDRERSSPTLIESGLKNLIGGRDSNYPLISGINGKYLISLFFFQNNLTKPFHILSRT